MTDGKDQKMQDPAAGLLARIFRLFDREDIAYCVLHGYERLNQEITSDVDCLINRNIKPHALLQLLCQNRDNLGADVVQQRDYYFVLAVPSGASFRFLQLDFCTDCTVDGVRVLSGNKILASRRRHEGFWIPAPEMEFVAYLVRILDQDKLTDERIGRLTGAFNQSPAAAQERLKAIFGNENASQIVAAAQSGNCSSVQNQAPEMSQAFRKRVLSGHPFARPAVAVRTFLKRRHRVAQPSGVSVVFLGPDGAGKSSVISELPARLAPALPRHTCQGFAPGLRSLWSRKTSPRRTDTPHLLQPRSAPLAVVRICYWLVFNLLSHLLLRVAVAGPCLVMYDRHFVDILVDQRRYRYAGPTWVLKILCALAPRPDLVIVLDAPATVLQSRKQEVPLEITAQQCASYRKLAQGIRQARIVDAAQPLPHVIDEVMSLVVDCLRRRIRRRAGAETRLAGWGYSVEAERLCRCFPANREYCWEFARLSARVLGLSLQIPNTLGVFCQFPEIETGNFQSENRETSM